MNTLVNKIFVCCLGNVAVFHSEHYFLALSKWYSLLFWLAKKCVMLSVCTVDASCSASYCSTGCTIQLTQLECPQVQESWATDELFMLTHRTHFGFLMHQSLVLWFSMNIATTPGCIRWLSISSTPVACKVCRNLNKIEHQVVALVAIQLRRQWL